MGTQAKSHGNKAFSTQDTLKADFKRLGLENGDGVFVHASMKSIGPVVGGARTVVSAIIEAVGESGLVAMPSFSNDACMPKWFDVNKSSQATTKLIQDAVPGHNATLTSCLEMGLIAEVFRNWPGTRRSSHPCVSVTARGPDSESFTKKHSLAWACGPDTPLGKFRTRPNMKIMLLGVDWTRCSALHTAETLVAARRTKRRVFKHGNAWRETDDVADDNGRLFPEVGMRFSQSQDVQINLIGQATTLLFPFAQLVEFATSEFDTLLEGTEGLLR